MSVRWLSNECHLTYSWKVFLVFDRKKSFWKAGTPCKVMKLENFVDLDLNFWNSMHLSLLTRSTKSKQFLSLQRLWFQKRHLEKTNKNFWQISVALATLWNVIVLFTVVYLHEVQLILGMHHDLLTIQNEIRRLPLNFPPVVLPPKRYNKR